MGGKRKYKVIMKVENDKFVNQRILKNGSWYLL